MRQYFYQENTTDGKFDSGIVGANQQSKPVTIKQIGVQSILVRVLWILA
jgi:hypothetical protein